MKILGTVINAKTDRPIKGAKVSLFIDETELAVLYTDENGEFEHSESDDYIGKTIVCSVEKEDFEKADLKQEIVEEEISLEVKLIRIRKDKTPIRLSRKQWIALFAGVAAVIILVMIVNSNKNSSDVSLLDTSEKSPVVASPVVPAESDKVGSYLGAWNNKNTSADIYKLVISSVDGDVLIKAFKKCGTRDCEWGPEKGVISSGTLTVSFRRDPRFSMTIKSPEPGLLKTAYVSAFVRYRGSFVKEMPVLFELPEGILLPRLDPIATPILIPSDS